MKDLLWKSSQIRLNFFVEKISESLDLNGKSSEKTAGFEKFSLFSYDNNAFHPQFFPQKKFCGDFDEINEFLGK